MNEQTALNITLHQNDTLMSYFILTLSGCQNDLTERVRVKVEAVMESLASIGMTYTEFYWEAGRIAKRAYTVIDANDVNAVEQVCRNLAQDFKILQGGRDE